MNKFEEILRNMNDLTEVYPCIFITSDTTANNELALKRANISAILRVQSETPSVDILRMYNKNGIDYIHIYAVDDDEFDLESLFPITNKVIDTYISRGKNIVVHCGAGISRSPTVVIAYLLSIRAVSGLKEAIECIQHKRSIIYPNNGFRAQLNNYWNTTILD